MKDGDVIPFSKSSGCSAVQVTWSFVYFYILIIFVQWKKKTSKIIYTFFVKKNNHFASRLFFFPHPQIIRLKINKGQVIRSPWNKNQWA